ncbi:MAG: glycerol-3-phosphate dehydrogenase/oxidase [Candidatus Promineifilaceae bacterium]
MQRDLARLRRERFDLLVVGGGIYGACAAWDGALRGLKVALIEAADFGGATSANSLKIIHGGLRYLQDGDLRLVRAMAAEQRTLMRIASGLIRPLPCLVGAYRAPWRSKAALGAALALAALLGRSVNGRGREPRLPAGRILSRKECLRRAPGLARPELTGGALWHDAQVQDSERLTLAFVLAASGRGAAVANYVWALGLEVDGRRVTGVRACDALTGTEFEIRAQVVLNAAGPWAQALIGPAGSSRAQARFRPSLAMNLVTRQILPDRALAVPGRVAAQGPAGAPQTRPQLFFIVPWRGHSILGTRHFGHSGELDAARPAREWALAFLEEVNAAYPDAGLTPADVRLIHSGFLPAVGGPAGGVKLLRRSPLVDHLAEDGLDGLITLVGVKYTAARRGAERAVDLACRKLGRAEAACLTALTPLPADFTRPPAATPAGVRHMIGCEMAHKLSDLIVRRSGLGAAGRPAPDLTRACAAIMAAELGWSRARLAQELAELDAYYAARSLN